MHETTEQLLKVNDKHVFFIAIIFSNGLFDIASFHLRLNNAFFSESKSVTKNLSKLLKTWFDRRSIISHCKETFYLTVIDFFTKTRSIDLLLNQRNNTEAAVLRYFLE